MGKFQEADLALRLGYLVRCRYAFVRSTSVFIPTWHFTTPAHTHITENLKPLRCDAGHTRISLAHCRTVPIRRGQPGTGTARPRSWLHRQTISPTLEPLALKTRASRLDFCQPRSIAGAALFQTDHFGDWARRTVLPVPKIIRRLASTHCKTVPTRGCPLPTGTLPRHNLGFGGNPTKLWRSPQGSAGQVSSLPPFLPMFATRSQRSARDTQGCFAMTKDPTRPDDLELDDLLRHLHLFGQAPSREYIAAVFSGQSVTKTRNRSERQSPSDNRTGPPVSGKRAL